MALPPFPPQDLAKLVLGYLVEEQLMTAYDEFLQASPYLDVFRNEYDRIVMTSLRNILAEYRAVKIYVETCKPHSLRKKLLQCSNLLEIVKFLVNYVDINRLHAQECTTEKINVKQSYLRSNIGCDVCNSLNLGACVCKRAHRSVSTLHPSQIETNFGISTETTSLDDLPGNSINKSKKNSKNEDLNETILSNSQVEKEQETGADVIHSVINTTYEPHLPIVVNEEKSHRNLYTEDVLAVNSDETQQKINNFNTYNVEYGKNDYLPLPKQNNSSNDTQKPVYNAGSFQEFAIGVSGSSDKEIPTVPDSSTAENYNMQSTVTKENKTNINPITNIKGPPKPQVIHKLATPINNDGKRNQKLRNIKAKPEDQKIKIISDVKFDEAVKNNMLKMPPLQPISSPLLQMQRIIINGTPAYKSKVQGKTYNKEEIMAMPTIILVPASGPSSSTVTSVSLAQNIVHTVTSSLPTTTTTASKSLGPLIVDVSSNSPNPVETSNKTGDTTSQEPTKIPVEMSLVKTVDFSHNSLPKDNNMDTANKTSTPNILPPTRKSSSTPRRTSHVRVLDFTTPRRILQETINEQDPNKDLITDVIDNPDTQNVVNVESSNEDMETKNVSTKENHIKKTKKNWDSELRVLAVRNDETIESTPRPKPKKLKKKMTPIVEKSQEISDDKAGSNMSCKKKVSPKTKKAKKTVKSADIVKEPVITIVDRVEEPIVKPTLNIISKSDWSTLEPKDSSKENNESQTKFNNSDERTDTPDAERLSLQNAIGAKLNISELLETPYKQVLYDIQMETPKFLGPDLPGEPVSDIKIMNIPTPRFFDSPKIIQATPSSYSSRPTDYSSGGSYYKPDDQDFVPEILTCAVTVVQEPCTDEKDEEEPKIEEKEEEKVEKPSRPQRKCTRNVSYRSPVSRAKDDGNSSTSATSSNSSIKEKKAKSVDAKNRSKSKSIPKKKVIPTAKSPFKKESLLKSTPNNYIKIKPFKTTSIKETSSKKKKTPTVLQNLSSKSLSRKRTSSKESNVQSTPIVPVTTKSRRKSSTPRKLDCTNSYKEKVDNTSSELSKSDQDVAKDCPQDSDLEQQPLRWSDDGSQDAKQKVQSTVSDEDEINKIKEFIQSTVPAKIDGEGSLHNDLVKRGFDAETAKIIERDLLDTSPIQDTAVQSTSNDFNLNKNDAQNVSDKLESDSSANNLQIVQEDDDIEEIEMSVHECVEGKENYITCQFDEANFVPKTDIPKLKDKFSMEVCIDDGVSIRLRSTNLKTLFEDDPTTYNPKETEMAVNSISNIEKLYTPMKDRRSQCYEIFDSTLTSIDTPIKNEMREFYETEVSEIILEVESIEVKEKPETKKRKRITSDVAEESVSKKTKPETRYLLNSANIQNIDIESVLSKLHGP
ncbi:unnamed protein product, partial [Brenthis ino]